MNNQLQVYMDWMKEEKLVCVTLLENKKGRQTIYGRILDIDIHRNRFLIYNVDAKRVETKTFSEIDDIKVASSNFVDD